jgi:hypothetical protein
MTFEHMFPVMIFWIFAPEHSIIDDEERQCKYADSFSD